MFKNYFPAGHFVKTAFRSLKRNGTYTIINIAGLAVGIAVCMVIFIIIQFQTSFDNFHAKRDCIYRVLVESFYKQENQLALLYKIFAAITIFLSCLGIYGLASFMAVQRIKEVGIRKVLGATVTNIVYLFSKEFVLLIATAFVITLPIVWYYMHQWLQNYPYRIDMSWWIFVLGLVAAIAIALVTVSFQAIKAAVANPVKSLRTE